jgi:23S rRNA pseudouridine955/2504/2580 synthase
MSTAEKTNQVRLVEVTTDRDGQRVDNFLSARMKGVPKAAIYRMIRKGQVRINGKRCKPASRLQDGDTVRIPPARTREDGQVIISERVLAQIKDAVLYQDSDLLVIDKPSGMAVHSGSGLPWGLIDVVRQMHPGTYLELAHRLDRETSGCLVLAKNGKSLGHLTRLFRENAIQKHYLCLLGGLMNADVMDVNAPLKKVQIDSERRVVVSEDGKSASTQFRLLQKYEDCSYAEAQIRSGRTHQIRVHAQFEGMPLAGDDKYSGQKSLRKWKNRGLRRLFLHAQRLTFDSLSGQNMTFSAPIPAGLKTVLDGLER